MWQCCDQSPNNFSIWQHRNIIFHMIKFHLMENELITTL
jgi:hypothetical protein